MWTGTSFLWRSSLLFLLLSAGAAAAQSTLIGPGIRNGDFEDGIVTPWGGISVVDDANFASQGNWYALAQTTNAGLVLARALAFQHLPASPVNGYGFIVTFAARNGTNGFDSVAASFEALNTGGVPVSRTTTPILAPILVASEWRTYQTYFQLPGSWDGGGNISLFLQFIRNGAVDGLPYVGYIDDVRLQQVPEPTALAFWFACGGGLLFASSRLRRPRG